MQTQALSHLRVLDLSRILAGPWASQLLADMGADVIKIEQPKKGDDTRCWGPPWWRDEVGQETTESAYFSCTNRGKRSVCIDISQPEGQALIHRLVAKCDILIENFKVGGLIKYQLDYASLKPLNPRLIYCSITGFGQTGSYKYRAGYDFMIQAMGGLMSVTGVKEGEAGAGPQKVGVALADILTGLYAANACLAALSYRQISGQGQYIDMALFDVQVATLANQAANYLATGKAPMRLGNAHPNIVPYQSFATKDGHFILAVGNDAQFARLAALLSQLQWLKEDRFATNAQRVAKREALVAELAPLLAEKSSAHWLGALEALNIPCGPINTLDQVFAEPPVSERELVLTTQHPTVGEMKMVANPIKFSLTPISQSAPPPLLGEHTDEVLHSLLALSADETAKLKSYKVVE